MGSSILHMFIQFIQRSYEGSVDRSNFIHDYFLLFVAKWLNNATAIPSTIVNSEILAGEKPAPFLGGGCFHGQSNRIPGFQRYFPFLQRRADDLIQPHSDVKLLPFIG